MTNKRVLSKAVSELDKAKAPAKSKDIIYDPMGQWKYPGENTRIPGNQITMQGVDYPVWAQPNVGPGTMMVPGQDYEFPEADYVDEYPEMKRGGSRKNKKYTRNIMATNKVFAENAIFKKPGKKQIYDPLADLYEDGGETDDYVDVDLTDEEIQAYRDGGYIVEDISVPQLTQAQKGITISDPKKYADRKAAYDDSLKLYNYDSKPIHELNLNSINFVKQNKNKLLTSSLKNKFQKKALNTLSKYTYPDLKSSVKNVPKEKTTIYDIEVNAKGNPYLFKNFTLTHKKPVQPVYFKDNVLKNSQESYDNIPELNPVMQNKLTLKKLEAEKHNEIIESKTKQVKPSSYKTAYRDQTIISYDPNIKQFISTGSRKAPLPYSEKIGVHPWELNASQEIPESGPRVWQVGGKDYYNEDDARKAQAFMPQGSYNFAPGGAVDLNPETMKKYLAALKVQENNESTGLRKNKWYPYPSSEKGTDTIGYGHKLLPGEQKYYEGVTTPQVEALAKKDVLEKQASAKGRVDAKYGKGTFDKLPQDAQMLLVDYQYNVGLQKFPKFVEAVVKGDKATMLKEYERTSNAGKLTKRNNWTKGVIDTLKYPVAEKPKKSYVFSIKQNNTSPDRGPS